MFPGMMKPNIGLVKKIKKDIEVFLGISLTNEKENGTTRSLESNKGRRMYSRPSLNIIRVGRVLDVTDVTILYFSTSFGDLATSILPNFRVLLAYLQVERFMLIVSSVQNLRFK